ncbi:MAG: L-seryl-tRNA(Sec) selenium transferase [Pyrinomonadaceae bacterium]|nr:L-seryl-tRNA(Sec) selenium transferase [Pyrinomonadaceae bacterium]
MSTEQLTVQNILRGLPSIDELVRQLMTHSDMAEAGLARVTEFARLSVDSLRSEVIAGSVTDQDLARLAEDRAVKMWLRTRQERLRRVINATGVVIHTNLGRAPLSESARRAIVESSGYCTVEYDLEAGGRGHRGTYVEDLIADVCGTEAAIVVNNCAAAAFLVLTVLASDGEVIISRGELVEIGGDFRVPDVLKATGAQLREVGTTNRTKITDYEHACGENTRMILRVHPSNYRIVGFTASPSIRAMADLARRKNVVLFEDIGSGALLGLGDEPVPSESLSDGADLVAFSGDKLLGGPQSGIIAGRRDLIDKIRKHPMYRVLRVDKLIYAALGATLESYTAGNAEREIPVLQMINCSREEIVERAVRFAGRIKKLNMGISASVCDGNSVIGGGSAPDIHPPTSLIAISHAELSADRIESALRRATPPVISRIENNLVLIDLRTVANDEEDLLFNAIAESFSPFSRQSPA